MMDGPSSLAPLDTPPHSVLLSLCRFFAPYDKPPIISAYSLFLVRTDGMAPSRMQSVDSGRDVVK